jgi:GTP cyclohydrolase I
MQRNISDAKSLRAQIVAAIEDVLKARGVAVMIEAEQACMSVRGIKKPGTSTTTTKLSGIFQKEASQQVRFMTLVRDR